MPDVVSVRVPWRQGHAESGLTAKHFRPISSYNDAKDDPEADAKVQKYREQAYSIYAQCGDDPTTWMYGAEDGASSEKVWGEQLSRMKALRLKVDPQGIMRGPNVIPVASS